MVRFATGCGLVTVLGVHIVAALKEATADRERATQVEACCPQRAVANSTNADGAVRTPRPTDDGFVDVCGADDIVEKRARIVCLSGERVAVFKFDGKVSGRLECVPAPERPAGRGRILDGCITCPWHVLPILTGDRCITAAVRRESPDVQRVCEERPSPRASGNQTLPAHGRNRRWSIPQRRLGRAPPVNENVPALCRDVATQT